MRVLAISSSPRRDGNSRLLADAVLDGVREAGHDAELVILDDHLKHFLRDCRTCRSADGACSLGDGFRALFLDKFLPAEAVVLATPIYWYGMSGQLKTFFDRMFCYTAASCATAGENVARMTGKRLALVLSSEESYVGASMGVLHQVQEYARYTHSHLVGVVNGIGNKRGDITRDPSNPVGKARDLGRRLFDLRATDYRIDTPRAGTVWPVVDDLAQA